MNILIPTVVMITLDTIYLTTTKSFYNKQVRLIQGSDLKIKGIPLLMLYGILILGLYYFILKDKRPVTDAMLLGFVIYFVVQLTNLAMFDKWNISSVLLDTTWGAVLFGLTTYATYRIKL